MTHSIPLRNLPEQAAAGRAQRQPVQVDKANDAEANPQQPDILVHPESKDESRNEKHDEQTEDETSHRNTHQDTIRETRRAEQVRRNFANAA